MEVSCAMTNRTAFAGRVKGDCCISLDGTVALFVAAGQTAVLEV